MTLATDLDALHAALDADPSDQDTRRVLADWYEDAGDMVMANGLRWMAGGDMSSEKPEMWMANGPRAPQKGKRSGRWKGWMWTCRLLSRDITRPSDLPEAIFRRLRDHTPWPARTARCEKTYPTRRAAEEALCRAMAPSNPEIDR